MKKNIYLVQAGCLYGDTYYLPYAVGMLAAFAMADSDINGSCDIKRIIYSLEDIENAIEGFEEPFAVGFSNSIWNYSYNLEFAQRLKERFPDCKIIFGGHHIPPDVSYLENYSFIDFLIHGKGEEAFRDIIRHLLGLEKIDGISNISYRNGSSAIKAPEAAITVCEYPSPYLTGVFDDIIKNGEYPFSCVLETNRGCPFNCCYCDWGELGSPVRLFPLERVFAELEWMSDNNIEFVYCVDANFGMFERDYQIAEKLVEMKERNNHPSRLQVSYAKNNPDMVFKINRLLAEHGIGKGATLSLQSMSEDVLKNIGRSNIDRREYKRLLKMYNDAGISTYTELIIGLPGETLATFKEGLCELLELGQHKSVTTYHCELLPNSRMSTKEFREKYKIETVSTVLEQYHCEDMENTLSGFSNLVVGTSTMSKEDWVEANVFSDFLQAFHHLGLTQALALYVRNECNVRYIDFYSGILDYIENETSFLKEIYTLVRNTLSDFVAGKGGLVYQNPIFGKITYPLEEAIFLLCAYDIDKFYDEIRKFLSRYCDSEFLNELIKYQKSIIVLPDCNDKECSFDYDFYSYFSAVLSDEKTELIKKTSRYRYSAQIKTCNWDDYSRYVIWYGRRNGRSLFSNKPNTISSF